MRLVLLLLVAAAPAGAQIAGTIHGDGWRPPSVAAGSGTPRVGTGAEVADIRGRIDDGRDTGQLTRREARQLRREARQLTTLADRYGQHGLSDAEARELDIRALVLRDQVNSRRGQGAGRAAPQRGR